MNRSSLGIPAVLLVLLLAACASTGTGAGERGGNRSVIGVSEIEQSSATNAYELVQQRRPHWLRLRGKASINRSGNVIVYQDGMRFGTIESLESLSVAQIESMRFLSGSEATMRFGTDHDSGAILITTR